MTCSLKSLSPSILLIFSFSCSDQLHSVPIAQMGNYQDFLKAAPQPLRDADPEQPKRLHTFGNPFKLDKKVHSTLTSYISAPPLIFFHEKQTNEEYWWNNSSFIFAINRPPHLPLRAWWSMKRMSLWLVLRTRARDQLTTTACRVEVLRDAGACHRCCVWAEPTRLQYRPLPALDPQQVRLTHLSPFSQLCSYSYG